MEKAWKKREPFSWMKLAKKYWRAVTRGTISISVERQGNTVSRALEIVPTAQLSLTLLLRLRTMLFKKALQPYKGSHLVMPAFALLAGNLGPRLSSNDTCRTRATSFNFKSTWIDNNRMNEKNPSPTSIPLLLIDEPLLFSFFKSPVSPANRYPQI